MVGDKGLGRIVGSGVDAFMFLGRVNFPAFNIIIHEINFSVKQQTFNLIDT